MIRSLLLSSCLVLAAAALPAATATVSWNEVHQRITGFGASGGNSSASRFMNLSTANQQALCDLLFSPDSGIGLSMVRNELYWTTEPSAGTWDWTKDNDQIWLMNQAKARGVSYFWSAAWSPPLWMKNSQVKSSSNGEYLLPAHYQDYADYLSRYVREYQSRFGLTISAVSIQNEPDMRVGYQGCIWDGGQIRDFIKNNLGPTFARDAVSAKIVLPEPSAWGNLPSYADATLSDPAASAYVGVIASHQYGGGVSAYPAAAIAGKELWETETSFIGGTPDYSIGSGISAVRMLHDALVNAEVNAWTWWVFLNPWGDNEGLADPNGNSFKTTKRLFAMGNYSKFVRPGWTMIGASHQPAANVYVTAFKDPSAGKFAIVVINNNGGDTAMDFQLSGFSPATVVPWVTSASLDLVQQPAITCAAGGFSAIMPASSVVTYTGSTIDPTKPYIVPSPGTVSASAAHGQDAPAQNIAIGNASAGSLATVQSSVSYDSGSNWLSLTPGGAGNAQTLGLQFHSSTLPGGTYSAVIHLSASGALPADATCAVTLTVARGQNDPLAINVGGPPVGSFAADQDFSGGSTYSSGNAVSVAGVANAAPAAVYQTSRYGAMTCSIPGLAAGTACTVRLHFSEPYWTAAGQRLFNVDLNGNRVLSSFDIYAAAGAKDKAVVRDISATVDGTGTVLLAFSNITDNASINGIEVIPRGGAPKPGDANGDGAVDAADLAIVKAQFGRSGTEVGDARADLDGNGRVEAADLGLVTRNQGH